MPDPIMTELVWLKRLVVVLILMNIAMSFRINDVITDTKIPCATVEWTAGDKYVCIRE